MADSTGTSSFDTLLQSAAPKPATPAQQSGGNAEGESTLLNSLLTTLKAAGGGTNSSNSASNEALDFSSLFADNDPPTKKAAPAPAGGEPDAEPEEEEVTFLSQLADDKVMGAVVNGITPSNNPIPSSLAALFGEGDDAVDSIEMTREGMAALINHTTAAASRQSMNQTINLLRQLVPALSKQTESVASQKYNVNKQMDIAMSEFNGNNELILLAQKLSKGKTIKDGRAFATQVKALMRTINSNEITTHDQARPAQAPTSKQFLATL